METLGLSQVLVGWLALSVALAGAPIAPGSPATLGSSISIAGGETPAVPPTGVGQAEALRADRAPCAAGCNLTRLLVAEDADPGRLGGPTGGQGGVLLRGVAATDGELNATQLGRLARAVDVAALSTRPAARLGPALRTVFESRLAQLATIDRSRSTSIRPKTAPPPEDSTYIKDAVIAFLGVTGATARLNGTRLDGTLLLPPNGTVLDFVDYRVEKPAPSSDTDSVREAKTVTVTADATGENESETETKRVTFHTPDGETLSTTVRVTAPANETRSVTRTITATVDGRRTRTTYRVENRSVRRQLQLGGHTWTKNTTPATPPRAARQLAYAGAPPGARRLRLRATITVWVRETTVEWDWHPTGLDTGHWERTDRSHRFLVDQQTVTTDRSPVRVTPHAGSSLGVRQRVITGLGKTVVVMRFDGPSALTHRRLWSWARFTDQQVLMHGWGVYARQHRPAGALEYSAAHPNGRGVAFPPTLRQRLTALAPAPTTLLVGGPPAANLARVTTTRSTAVGRGAARLAPQVNLSTAQPHVTRLVVLRSAPGPVSALYDIHGDRIPITTTRAVFRATRIRLTRRNATMAKLELVDRETGAPLAGRTLTLDGARQMRVTTNRQGVAIVAVPASSTGLRASFAGDPVTATKSVYYLESSATLSMAGPYEMGDTFLALFTTGLPFYVMAALLSAVYLIFRARPG